MADIRNVLIVGAGTMGLQIGLQSAMHGFEVTIHDKSEDALEAGQKRIRKLLSKLEGYRYTEPYTTVEARLRFTTDLLDKASEIDIVCESVPEDPELKGQIFAELHQHVPAHTIFTTNTSTLLPSMFANASGRPDRLIALHFHPDVWTSNVVDIMPHSGTSQETINTTETFARSIGQIPIVLSKEHSGYVFNTLLVSLLSAANQLVVDEVTSFQDVDRAWMGIMHTPNGPFGIMDYIGLDTIYKVVEFWAQHNQDPVQQQTANYFKEHFIDKGHLGVKTGQGFYQYPQPEFSQPDFLQVKNERMSK
uniref:3-hydroxyacyl-CoA dehydrogenase n=1 Tax=Roseihalotalea indica TaxID=2867963 RepID=A0AA49JG53_9BACT|nr:3-hydroxyacyl-CoA dehydrogenase [Tunicatimonas sp. TK19036]